MRDSSGGDSSFDAELTQIIEKNKNFLLRAKSVTHELISLLEENEIENQTVMICKLQEVSRDLSVAYGRLAKFAQKSREGKKVVGEWLEYFDSSARKFTGVATSTAKSLHSILGDSEEEL